MTAGRHNQVTAVFKLAGVSEWAVKETHQASSLPHLKTAKGPAYTTHRGTDGCQRNSWTAKKQSKAWHSANCGCISGKFEKSAEEVASTVPSLSTITEALLQLTAAPSTTP